MAGAVAGYLIGQSLRGDGKPTVVKQVNPYKGYDVVDVRTKLRKHKPTKAELAEKRRKARKRKQRSKSMLDF